MNTTTKNDSATWSAAALPLAQREAIVGRFNERVTGALLQSPPTKELVKNALHRKGAPRCLVRLQRLSLDVSLALQERVWDAGYEFDSITWTDDLAYKNGLFFSLDMCRALLKPVQKRAVEWAHRKGVKVRCHSDGNISAVLPDLIDVGIDMLHPLEVKVGMDALEVK